MLNPISRRDALKAGAVAAGALLTPSVFASALRRGDDALRVGVIGCGGRGTGAAFNAIEAHPSVRVVALADLFPDRLERSRAALAEGEELAGRGVVAPERCYHGFDAYQRLLNDGGLDMVVLATPPQFRPQHFAAAVAAGLHVFMEKPAAVCPAGVRMVIDAGEQARLANLSVVTGTQRRHQENYLAAMRELADGRLGVITSAECYWNQGGLWVHERKPEYTDVEWQCRNWLYFAWLSGDHIVEQHVHNIDVINWAKDAHPVKALGLGGRQVRTSPQYGSVFDHFAVRYEYADGTPLLSMCRQIDGTAGRVEEVIHGTQGRLITRHGRSEIIGQGPWQHEGQDNPYVTEHANLIKSIRGEGPYLNEARRVAESTLTAIMGRMSAYTGQEVSWDQAMKSALDLRCLSCEFGPREVDPVPVPGRTPLI